MQKLEYKPIQDYLALDWTIIINKSDDPIDPYTARVQELPGCMSHGKSLSEAAQNVEEAIESYLLSLMENGEPIPEPFHPEQFKGVLTYRPGAHRHYLIAKKARQKGVSLQKLIDEALDKELAS